MSNSRICYVPVKGIDDVIANQVPSWNSHYVANLRGLYETEKGVSTTDIKELIAFRRELTAEDAKALTEAITNPIAAYDQLKLAFSTQERVDRVNMIANVFSDVVDMLQQENPNVDREDIIKGFTDKNGKFQGGPAFIYNLVFKTLKEDMEEAAEDGDAEAVDKYRQVFKNWGALVSYANTIIRDMEGFKIGANLTFASNSNLSDYEENTLIESFVAEESTRESWQEVSESVSPFGATSILVRRVLSRLTHYTSTKEEDYDDLGYIRTLSPVKVHQSLMDLLRGMINESDMVRIMKSGKATRPYISEILSMFEKDPILRTQFFVDFSRTFQLYSMQEEKSKGNTIEYKNSILNILTLKEAYKRYSAALATRTLDANNALFRYTSEGTVVSTARAKELADHIEKYLGTETDLFGKFNDFSNQERINFYKSVFPILGIDLTGEDYDVLVKDNRKTQRLNETLKSLPKILRMAKEGQSFQDLINLKIGKEAKEGYLKEKLSKIFQITESLESGRNILSRIRFQGNTYYSDVQSSYLGRFKDAIERYSRSADKTGLAFFLESNYLGNRTFQDTNKKIFNRWLRELYFNSQSKGKNFNKNSFVSKFTYKKFLGDNNQKFEDFPPKKQAITLINEYFAETKDYGWYPVFILGDSGASKWIRAPRYSFDSIVDGLYDIFLSEKEFQKELEELKNGLSKEGKSLGSLSKIDSNKFGLLPFLNGVSIDTSNIETSVKNAIREHLKEAFEEFKTNISNVGLYEKVGDKYKYLNKLTSIKGEKLSAEEAIDKNLFDYFCNSKFATIMQMNLMTVNPIFYKNGDSTDLQKRYKQIHASGNRLSLEAVNPFTGKKFLERSYQTTVYFDEVKLNTEDTNPEFMEVLANVYGKDSDIYNEYKEVSATDGQGYRTLQSYRAVMGMSGKWNKKCEDAYNKIKQIREEIRNNDGNITEEQSKRISELLATFQPIKPLLYTLERLKLGDSIFQVPVQLKYAECVMIPELLPKGSKLRDMIEWAENNDVDVLAATSAVKVGSFGSVDVKSASNKEELNESLKNSVIHNLSYNDYVIQNNVPEHIQGSQLFATQSRKLIFAGLKDRDEQGNTIYYDNYTDGNLVNIGGEPVRLNAYTLNRFYISLIAANILEDLDSFSSIIENPEKVRQALVQMTINNSRETKDNLRGYGKGLEHDFLMQLFEGGIEHDTAALLLSMFKKQVNKQKILGGSGVQVSDFGITGYEENNNLKFVKDPNNPNNILYAECELPWDLSYTDNLGNKVDLKFNDWCNPDGTLKMGNNGKSLLEEKFPNILSFIAYRIPTEEKYSMLNLKVVRFTQKVNGGGVIKVPAQGTKIAGFDFDIDKLYFMRREYKMKTQLTEEQIKKIWESIYKENPTIKAALQDARRQNEITQEYINSIFKGSKTELGQSIANTEVARDRLYKYWKDAGLEGTPEQVFNEYLQQHSDKYLTFEEYDYSKPAWGESQSRVARNNMLIQLMQKRLEDPQTIKERTTPGGFTHASAAAKYLRKLMGIENVNYDFSDPWTMVVYNQQNQVAGKLIGIFANQNVNNAISSLMSEFRLTNPIAFGNHSKGLSNLINPNALTKELLAASVDAVKDPVLNFLNLNTITADSAGMLCRLGYSFEEIGLLMNQPIIKDLCNYCMEYNMSNIDVAIDEVLNKWGAKGDYANFNSADITISVLEKGITDFKDNPNIKKNDAFIKQQAQILELFRTIYATSKEVSSFVTNTKFTASNAVKSTFGGMYAQQDKVAKYVKDLQEREGNPRIVLKVSKFLNSPIELGLNTKNKDEYIMKILDNPFGYEQVMYDANVKAIKDLERYYPYGNSTYTKVRSFMSELSKSGLDEDTINDIHAYMLEYMISNQEHSIFNPEESISLSNGETVKAIDYYSNYVPLEVSNLRRKNYDLAQLPIFKYLMFYENSDGNVEMKLGDAGALTPTQKEEIRDSWEILLNNPETSEIAKKLYMYSYYKSGFGFGVVGFNHLAPLELKLNLALNGEYSYTHFLEDVLDDNLSADEVRFAQKFFDTHRKSKLIYTPKAAQRSEIKKYVYENGAPVSYFTVDSTKDKNKTKAYILRTKGGITHFVPAILVDGLLYVAVGNNFNKSSDGSMTYKLIRPEEKKKVTLATLGLQTDESTTSIDGEEVIDLDTLSVDKLIEEIVKQEVKAGDTVAEQANQRITTISNMITSTNIEEAKQDLINWLIELYKNSGVKCKLNGKEIC